MTLSLRSNMLNAEPCATFMSGMTNGLPPPSATVFSSGLFAGFQTKGMDLQELAGRSARGDPFRHTGHLALLRRTTVFVLRLD
jgi:hypothetical protein